MNWRIDISCLCFLLIWNTTVYSQSPFIDSLKSLVATQKKDSFYVKNLIELGIQTRSLDLQVSKDYFDQAISTARTCSFERGEMLGYYHRAVIEFFLSDYAKVDSFLELSSVISEKREDLAMATAIENVRGVAYQNSGQLERALSSLQRSANIALRSNDSVAYGIALGNIADVHLRFKNYPLSQKYYLDALDLLERLGEPEYYVATYIGLASSARDEPTKKVYALKALETGKEFGLTQAVIYALTSLGEAYRNNPDSIHLAESYLLEAMPLAEEYGEVHIHSAVLLDLGEVYFLQGKYDRAVELLNQAHDLSMENEIIEKTMYSSLLLSKIHESRSNLSKAYYYLKEAYTFSDSFYNDNLTQQVSYSNALFESEKRESELLRQQVVLDKQKNHNRLFRLYSVGTLLLLSTLFFGIYQRIKRKRKETEFALSLELQRANDLEVLAQVKTDFFNNVSHELRTPLTLVIAPLQDAVEKVKNIGLKQDLNLALKNSKKLLNLTNEILDLSKMEADQLSLELRSLPIIGFLKRVFHSFDSLAKSRNVRLIDNLGEPTEYIATTDAHKLEKILNNLISNALKYSDDDTEVKFILNHETLSGGHLQVSVTDYGRGISSDEQERVFDRFYQSTGPYQSSGTGIGLALVKDFCNLMGGTIHLNSKVGEGSTFSIDIPIHDVHLSDMLFATEDMAPAKKQHSAILIKGQRPRILFVEDDLEMSGYLISLFGKEFICEAAYNGKQAIEKMKQNHYDLISSDIMMPEMDGFKFREIISQVAKWKNTPFIMLTARGLEEDKLRGLQLGIDDYIIKPFSSGEIIARVHNLLKNKISRDDVELEPSEVVTHASDFVQRAEKLVLENIENENFKVDDLASELNYSSRQLARLIQKYTGFTPVNFILEIRLQKAYQLLKERKYSTVNEVRYDVGIESRSYFTTAFKERFGQNPSKII